MTTDNINSKNIYLFIKSEEDTIQVTMGASTICMR